MDPLDTDVGIGEGGGQVKHVGVGRLGAIFDLAGQLEDVFALSRDFALVLNVGVSRFKLYFE